MYLIGEIIVVIRGTFICTSCVSVYGKTGGISGMCAVMHPVLTRDSRNFENAERLTSVNLSLS